MEHREAHQRAAGDDLRAELDRTREEASEVQQRLDSLELIHSALATDHDRLQNLHKLLTAEYEHIRAENGGLKQRARTDKVSPFLPDKCMFLYFFQ